MGWTHFTLMEAVAFSNDAHALILRVFVTASETLDDEWKRYVKSLEKYISEDIEVDRALQEKDWEEELHRQRMQGVGALALDWLMSSLKGTILGSKRYLDKSHPADLKGYRTKKGWLLDVSKEYKDRFGIDFTVSPVPFDRIEELVFARNAGIHREDYGSLEEYIAKVKNPRFVDDERRFIVTRDALEVVIKECEQFVQSVVSDIEKLRAFTMQGGHITFMP